MVRRRLVRKDQNTLMLTSRRRRPRPVCLSVCRAFVNRLHIKSGSALIGWVKPQWVEPKDPRAKTEQEAGRQIGFRCENPETWVILNSL